MSNNNYVTRQSQQLFEKTITQTTTVQSQYHPNIISSLPIAQSQLILNKSNSHQNFNVNDRPSSSPNRSYDQGNPIQRPTLSTRNSELRRSYAPSPQNDQRPDLRNHFDIVIFLMTIELERLMNENDKLKYRIKEMTDKYLDRSSYEQQIMDLQFRLNEQLDQFNIEKNEMIEINRELQYEIQQLRIEIDSLMKKAQQKEDQMINEIQTIRTQYEIEKSEIFEKQILRVTQQYNQEKEYLENELKKFRNILDIRNQEIEDWRNKYHNIQYLLNQAQQQEQHFKDSEKQRQILERQIEQLNNAVSGKLEETESWKQKYLKLDKNYQQQLEAECKKNRILEQNLSDNQQQIKNLMEELQKLNIALRLKIEQIDILENDKIKSLNERCQFQLNEIEKLRYQLQQKTSEIDDFTAQINRYEINRRDYGNIKQELEDRLTLQAQEIERLNHLIRQKTVENEELKKALEQLQYQHRYEIVEKENKIIDQIQLIESYQSTQHDYESEIEYLRQKEQKLNEFELKNKNLIYEIEGLKIQIRKLETDKDLLQDDLEKVEMNFNKNLDIITDDFNQKLKNLNDELYQANKTIDDKNQELNDLRWSMDTLKLQLNQKLNELNERIEYLTSQIERLQASEQNVKRENDGLNQQIETLQNINTETNSIIKKCESKISLYETQMDSLNQEMSRLHDLLKLRQIEYEDLKSKYNTVLSSLRSSESLVEDYRKKLEDLEQDISSLSIYKDLCKKFEQEIKQLKQELGNKNQLVDDRNSEINKLKDLIKGLQSQIDYLQKYEENIRILSREIDRLNEELQTANIELEDWRLNYSEAGSLSKRVQDQLCLLSLAFVEIEALRLKVIDKEKEVEEMRRDSLAPYRK